MAASVAPSTTSFINSAIGYDEFYNAKKLASSGRYLAAKKLFKEVIRMRPDAASPHWHLGCVLVELNRLQEAVSHFRKATRIKPEIVKYRQFLKWYSNLYQCLYNDGETPGGPSKPIPEEHSEDESKDDHKVDLKRDITDYGNEHYSVNKNRFNHFSVEQLLKEFCPSKYHLKPRATMKQKMKALKQAMKLYDPKLNENSHQPYYKYNTRSHPDLNQKHLHQLLSHHYKLLTQHQEKLRLQKLNLKNLKKHGNCPLCFAPLSMACEHTFKKNKQGKVEPRHRYTYLFEVSEKLENIAKKEKKEKAGK